MATLVNRGTLLFTPESGAQQQLSSNTTATVVTVTYGLEVSHAAAVDTFVPGDTVSYTVLLRNTGTGTLFEPRVTVDSGGSALSYVDGSATAFLYANGTVTAVPVTAAQNSPITFTFDTVIPAGGILFLSYDALVASTAPDVIVSTATGSAREGSATGALLTDSDTATITRVTLTVTKSAPGEAQVGESISYVFTVTNDSAGRVSFDRLTDSLPEGFGFTGISLVVGGVAVPLTAGVDYTVSESGELVLAPAGTVFLPAGSSAIVTITGVVTA